MFVIGGRAPVARWGMGSLQEMDHVQVVQSITKKALTLGSAEEAYSTTADCVRTALSRRTGPVFMDVPLAALVAAADLPEATEHLPPEPGARPVPEEVKKMGRLRREADGPAVIAGASVWWAHAEDDVKRLIEGARLPLNVNGMARGVLPGGHPLFFPRARGKALGEADLILVIGAQLDFRLNWGQPPVFAQDAKLVYLDVDNFRKHRPAEGALYGDLRASVSALATAWAGIPERAQWLAHLRESEAAARAADASMTQSDSSLLHPARLIAEVDRYADHDPVVFGDGGDFVSFAGRLIERPKPGLWVDPGPFGCLGSGPAFAIG